MMECTCKGDDLFDLLNGDLGYKILGVLDIISLVHLSKTSKLLYHVARGWLLKEKWTLYPPNYSNKKRTIDYILWKFGSETPSYNHYEHLPLYIYNKKPSVYYSVKEDTFNVTKDTYILERLMPVVKDIHHAYNEIIPSPEQVWTINCMKVTEPTEETKFRRHMLRDEYGNPPDSLRYSMKRAFFTKPYFMNMTEHEADDTVRQQINVEECIVVKLDVRTCKPKLNMDMTKIIQKWRRDHPSEGVPWNAANKSDFSRF